MIWDNPSYVIIDGEKFEIENGCDYRVVLDCLLAYEDTSLSISEQHETALIIFYKEPKKIKNVKEAIIQMSRIIDGIRDDVEVPAGESDSHTRIMSWRKDFRFIAPAISRILGYDICTPGKFTHWWTLLGAYQEIGGDCLWSTFIGIRNKRQKGIRLEKWEQKIYQENKEHIDLPCDITEEEREWLDSEW